MYTAEYVFKLKTLSLKRIYQVDQNQSFRKWIESLKVKETYQYDFFFNLVGKRI